MTPPTLLEVVRWQRFQLAILLVPLSRAVFVPLGVVPPGFEESDVAPAVRVAALVLLGIGAAVGIVGVLRQWPIVERAGLHLLAPLCIAYTLVLLAADWKAAIVSGLIYTAIAAASLDRAVEITRSMRVANRWLADQE